jgi:hypothetical protein
VLVGPELADLVRQHERTRSQLRSGRIVYETKEWCSEARLDAYRERWEGLARVYADGISAADLPPAAVEMNRQVAERFKADADDFAMVDFLRANGAYAARLTFDRDARSSIWTKQDTRDLALLSLQNRLSEAAVARLPAMQLNVCTDGLLLRYESPSHLALLSSEGQVDAVPALGEILAVRAGLLSRDLLGRGHWEVSPGARGQVCLDKADGGRHDTLVLDPTVGHRMREWLREEDGLLRRKDSWTYQVWADDIFPATYERIRYSPDGTESERLTCAFTAVELNVAIEASEFEFELAADVEVNDAHTGKTLKPAGDAGPLIYGLLTLPELRQLLLDYAASKKADTELWP